MGNLVHLGSHSNPNTARLFTVYFVLSLITKAIQNQQKVTHLDHLYSADKYVYGYTDTSNATVSLTSLLVFHSWNNRAPVCSDFWRDARTFLLFISISKVFGIASGDHTTELHT